MTREEALNAITSFVENYACGSDLDGLKEAIEALKRPHGDWKPDGTCSECGVYSSLNKNTAYFCPNCGADMRDKKDDLAEIIEAVQSIKESEGDDGNGRLSGTS